MQVSLWTSNTRFTLRMDGHLQHRSACGTFKQFRILPKWQNDFEIFLEFLGLKTPRWGWDTHRLCYLAEKDETIWDLCNVVQIFQWFRRKLFSKQLSSMLYLRIIAATRPGSQSLEFTASVKPGKIWEYLSSSKVKKVAFSQILSARFFVFFTDDSMTRILRSNLICEDWAPQFVSCRYW